MKFQRSYQIKLQLLVIVVLCAFHSSSYSQDTSVRVHGRVTQSDSEPIAKAKVAAVYLSRFPKDHPQSGSTFARVAGKGETDAEGKYQMSIRNADPESDIALEVFAYSEGCGTQFEFPEVSIQHDNINFVLHKAASVRGQILDADGKPAANTTLKVVSFRSTLEGRDNAFPFAETPSSFESWPKAVQSGSDGRFEIRSIGHNTEFVVEVVDARFARQRWTFAIGDRDPPEIEFKATPTRVAQGAVLNVVDRSPVAEATVVLSFYNDDEYISSTHVNTDKAGQFRMDCFAAKTIDIKVIPNTAGKKELRRRIPWVDGTQVQQMTLPIDPYGYERTDGTTFDGKAQFTIDVEVPKAEVTTLRVLTQMKKPVAGSLYVVGTLNCVDRPAIQGVFKVEPNTGQITPIVEGARWMSLSSNGFYLATISDSGKLTIAETNSQTPPLTTPKLDESKFLGACWIPNSKRLLLQKEVLVKKPYLGEDFWQLDTEAWQLDVESCQLTQLTQPSHYTVFDVSPDGKSLAVYWDTHCHRTGAQLALSNLDGTERRPLAQRREQYYWYPRFSPDGRRVIAKCLDARTQKDDSGLIGSSIRILDLDGSKEVAVESDDVLAPQIACWSPEGRAIAVLSRDESANARSGARSSGIRIYDLEALEYRDVVPTNGTFSGSDVAWR